MIKNDLVTIKNTLRQNGQALRVIASQVIAGEFTEEHEVLAAYEATQNAIENCDNFYEYITGHINTPEMLIVASEDKSGTTDKLMSGVLQVRAQADILANVISNTYGIVAADDDEDDDEDESDADKDEDDGEDIEGDDIEAEDDEDVEADEDFDLYADEDEDEMDVDADEDFDLYAEDEEDGEDDIEAEEDYVPVLTGVRRNSVSANQVRASSRQQGKDMRFNSVTASQGGRGAKLFDFIG